MSRITKMQKFKSDGLTLKMHNFKCIWSTDLRLYKVNINLAAGKYQNMHINKT